MDDKQENKKEKYWYYMTIYECVLCGEEEVYRERRYTSKPENWNDRHEYHQEACDNCWYGMKL